MTRRAERKAAVPKQPARPRQIAHIERLDVYLDLRPEARRMGTLVWSRDQRRAYFEYHPDFVMDPLPVSPFRLPVGPGVRAAPYQPFDGLHGLFNDSLPDGWGRKLLDRWLQKAGYEYLSLTPLDRLAFVGETGMGALRFVPERRFAGARGTTADLDWLARQAELVQQDVNMADVDLLQAAQGGSSGARPKVMVHLSHDGSRVVADVGQAVADGFDSWIVKFPSSDDFKEIGAEEFAYSMMARQAGVDVPDARLLRTARGGRYFAVRRFDRAPGGRHHVHTVSGLLEADHRVPSIDYMLLLRATQRLTNDARCVCQMFRRMVFNVLAHNRDDHTKNHAFMMEGDGSWHPTPAYDLTFSAGPGGEHNLAVGGEGRAPKLPHILKVAADAAIASSDAKSIFEQVRSVVKRWPEFAEAAGLSEYRMAAIDHVVNGRGPGPQDDGNSALPSSS